MTEVPRCFVIMPISVGSHVKERYRSNDDHFTEVYDHLIKPAVERAGYETQAPSRQGTENIPAAIINDLQESDLILADLSALNANVFFELGIRSALDKPVCLIWDGLDRLPFDTSHLNTFKYDPHPEWTRVQAQQDELVHHITATIANSADGRNALWKYFGSAARLDLASAEVNADDTSLPGKLEDIADRLSRIERAIYNRAEESPRRGEADLEPEDLERVREAAIESLLFGPVHGSKVGRTIKAILGPSKSLAFLGVPASLSAALRKAGVPLLTDSSGNFSLSAEDRQKLMSEQPDWIRDLMNPHTDTSE